MRFCQLFRRAAERRRRGRSGGHQAVLASAVAAAMLAQTVSPGAQTAFEAASIKPSDPRSAAMVVPAMFLPGGRWSAQRATLAMILRSAYELPANRIVGLPRWAATQRFDIVAVAAPGTRPPQLPAMARQLLAERFGLRAHIEPQIAEVHALVRTDASAPLPPGLRPAVASCARDVAPKAETVLPACREALSKTIGGAFRVQLRDRPVGDFLILTGAREEIGDGTPIVDRTGLTGRFDLDLEYVDQSAIVARTAQPGPPLAVAIVEQLGLRVETRRESVDVLVVESVTMPTEN